MRKTRLHRQTDRGTQPPSSWMLTFSDLCTLLLTFFVLLLSMSLPNKKAFESTFGNMERSRNAVATQPNTAASSRDLAIRDMSDGIQKNGSMKVLSSSDSSYTEETMAATETAVKAENTVFLENDRADDRFSFVLDGNLLFGKEEAVINPDVQFILEAMGSFLHESNYRAYVDAHASATQTSHGRYATADELSAARGRAVLSFLINSCRVNPARLSLGCYSSARPMTTGKASAGRAMNQHIEVIFEKTS